MFCLKLTPDVLVIFPQFLSKTQACWPIIWKQPWVKGFRKRPHDYGQKSHILHPKGKISKTNFESKTASRLGLAVLFVFLGGLSDTRNTMCSKQYFLKKSVFLVSERPEKLASSSYDLRRSRGGYGPRPCNPNKLGNRLWKARSHRRVAHTRKNKGAGVVATPHGVLPRDSH